MVKHDICVQGVGLNGVTQAKPVLLQMNDDDFPNASLRDLEAMGTASLSSTTSLAAPPSSTLTLYQPVTRVLHLGLVQLACESPGYPRLDPKRVLSAGLVIRQAPLAGGAPATAWPWMKNSNGQSAWVQRDPSQADDDPDPTKRPLLQSGQPALDQMLAALTLASAMTESTTPAFVAAPDVCNAAKRTLVYALIPTASNEASTQRPPSVAQLDTSTLKAILPTPLKAGKHSAPYADECVNYPVHVRPVRHQQQRERFSHLLHNLANAVQHVRRLQPHPGRGSAPERSKRVQRDHTNQLGLRAEAHGQVLPGGGLYWNNRWLVFGSSLELDG
jgi:hypothetical protein